MHLAYKLWYENDAKALFGEHKLALLEKIDQTGSISKSAELLGIDYHKAHDMLETMEEAFKPNELVYKTRGRNGGTMLSSEAKELLEKYIEIRDNFGFLIDIINKNYSAAKLLCDEMKAKYSLIVEQSDEEKV